MTTRTKDVDLYENQGSLIGLGPTQVVSFTSFSTPEAATIEFDDSAPNDGRWNAGESATVNGDTATLAATGVAYSGVQVVLLGITLADIQLSSAVNVGVMETDGGQYLRFYDDAGNDVDPAALLDSLASQLVTSLTGSFGPLLQPLVNTILLDPVGYVEKNALLTMKLTPGGKVPFVPCFVAGTKILTRKGEVAVENLAIGDEVFTVDNGHRPIRWIGTRSLTRRQLDLAPQLRPIRIEVGALGHGLPVRPLIVSPQHRCLIRSKIAERVTGEREVLVAAKQLLDMDGISGVQDSQPVQYFHILLDTHEVLISNGAQTESLFVGPVAMASMSTEARMEILSLFPDLAHLDIATVMPPARKLVAGKLARAIVARSKRNSKKLVDADMAMAAVAQPSCAAFAHSHNAF